MFLKLILFLFFHFFLFFFYFFHFFLFFLLLFFLFSFFLSCSPHTYQERPHPDVAGEALVRLCVIEVGRDVKDVEADEKLDVHQQNAQRRNLIREKEVAENDVCGGRSHHAPDCAHEPVVRLERKVEKRRRKRREQHQRQRKDRQSGHPRKTARLRNSQRPRKEAEAPVESDGGFGRKRKKERKKRRKS